MRFKINLFSLIFIVSLLSFILDVHAQIGFIRGEVKDEEGNPVEGVLIRIEAMGVKRKYQLKTNKEGKYYHGGVSFQSRYRVIAQKEGYQTIYVEGVQPQFRGAMDQRKRGVVDFTLKKGQAGRLAFELSPEEREKLMKQSQEAKRAQAEDEAKLAAVKQSTNRGLMFYNRGQYEQALQYFKEGLEKDDQQPALWARLGNTHAKMEQYDQAVESYQKAITLSPEDPALFQNLGGIYSTKGDAEKAREAYDKAATLSVGIDPKAVATNYYNMGVTYINSNRTPEAVEVLTKALEVDPEHAEAHYQLGISLLGINQVEKSLDHLKKYLELKPDGPDAETAKALVEELGK